MKLVFTLLAIILMPQPVSYHYEVASLVLNGTKMIIPRYRVTISERVNVSYSEIILDFTVIKTVFAWLRKVENGTGSYWNNTVGPITCCFAGRIEPGDLQFDLDLGAFSGIMNFVKRIDWDKEKGTMRIESRAERPAPWGTLKAYMILGLRKIFLAVQHHESVQAFLDDRTGYAIERVTEYGKAIPMAKLRVAVKNQDSNRTKITIFVVNEISGEISRQGNAWKVTDVRKTNLDAGFHKEYEDYFMRVLKDLDTSRPVGRSRTLRTVHGQIAVELMPIEPYF